MKVFISWSKRRSQIVAETLHWWLSSVIQAVETFYSEKSIPKGSTGATAIKAALAEMQVGIVCLTRENLNDPWINFEAGAISKTGDSYVWTLLIGLDYGDLVPPLSTFQFTRTNEEDVYEMIAAINESLSVVANEKPLPAHVLQKSFKIFWPELEKSLKEAEGFVNADTTTSSALVTEPVRTERELVLEMLDTLRSLDRNPQSVPSIFEIFKDAVNEIVIALEVEGSLTEDLRAMILAITADVLPGLYKVGIQESIFANEVILHFNRPISSSMAELIVSMLKTHLGVSFKHRVS